MPPPVNSEKGLAFEEFRQFICRKGKAKPWIKILAFDDNK
jgi:hypothetical protein